MKKYFLLPILLILISMSLIALSSADQSSKIQKIDSKVYSSLENNEEISVIVQIDNSSTSSKKKFLFFSAENKNPEIEKKLQNTERKYKDLAIIKISKKDLEYLNTTNSIKKISFPHQIQASLQDSAPLLNATISWNLQANSINLTGASETVCVLDSGINFSHPDLIGKNKTCIIDCYNKDCVENCSVGDNNGHGTHVAGIVAAAGGIRGISTGADLIGVKVLGSNGLGSSNAQFDLTYAIDWCTDNKEAYNISVITMSLGTSENWSDYCDSDFAGTWTDAINRAFAKNISITIAAGNDGFTSKISAPACIQNSTPVGATDKSDAIASYSNRNIRLKLFAPGSSINSTKVSSSYEIRQGTSMATPHVAGAIAIINQYLKLTGQAKNPKQIEAILNNTGKLIIDSTAGAVANYTRINVYNAIISLDSQLPNVSLISPSNNLQTSTQNQTFICNATDLSLKNLTFFIWNSSNSIINQTSQSIAGASNEFQINLTNIQEGIYKWNCRYTDENNNFAFASSNFTFNYLKISVNLISPSNNLQTSTQNQTFICNATSTYFLSNVTFFIWNSTGIQNSSSRNITGISNSTNFSYNLTQEGNYTWNCLFSDNQSNKQSAASNFSIRYDLTPPALTISPLNISFNSGIFGASLNEQGSCNYSLNDGLTNLTMSTSDNFNFTASNQTLIQNENYNLTYYCRDLAGNLNQTSIIFTADLTKPNITLISPADSYSATGTTTITFQYNLSDNLNISSCSLIINNALSLADSNITNLSSIYSFTQTFSPGTYAWKINCTDMAENIGNSTTFTFTINSPPTATVSSSSGGGSSGGSGEATTQKSTTLYPPASQLAGGYSTILKKTDKLQFTINAASTNNILDKNSSISISENHTLSIESIQANYAIIKIQSNPIYLILNVEDSQKINLTSSDYYDIYLRLNSIANNSINLTIKTIFESIVQEQKQNPDSNTKENKTLSEDIPQNQTSGQNTQLMLFILFSILILIVIVVVIIRIIKSPVQKTNRKFRKKR